MLIAIVITVFLAAVEAYKTVVSVSGDGVATLKPTGSTTNYVSGNPSFIAFPELAVDGDTNPAFNGGSCYHSNFGDKNPVWYVDLGRTYEVVSVKIVNRVGCCGERLGNVTIDLTSGNPFGTSVGTVNNCGFISKGTTGVDVTTLCKPVTTTPKHLWYEPNFPSGRYVRISKTEEFLTMCEVLVTVKTDNCMTVKDTHSPL